MIDRYGSSDNVLGELIRGKLVSQVFVAKDNYLKAVSFDFGTYMRVNKCSVFFELTRNGKLISGCEIKANVLCDNQFYKIPLDIELDVGSLYEVKLYSDGCMGNAITPKYGRPITSTCIYQIVAGRVVEVDGNCANIIRCNNPDKVRIKQLTTLDCKKEKCNCFTTYDKAAVDGLWMRMNGIMIRGQLCCLFHYGMEDDQDVLLKGASTYSAIEDKKSNIELSIVIPTALRIDHLKRCLDSIRAYTNCSYEVIVVINSKSKAFVESTVKLLMLYKNHSFCVMDDFAGYVKTCNLGVSKSVGSYICIMNDDVIVKHKWFDELKAGFIDKNVAQVGPGEYSYIDKTFTRSKDPTSNFYIEGWCFVIPRWVYEKFGLFDPNIEFAYCEDSDFSTTLQKNGHKILVVKSNVKHLKTQTAHFSDELKTFTRRCELRNKAYLIKKWKL